MLYTEAVCAAHCQETVRDLLTALLVPLLLHFPDLKLFSQLHVRLGGAVSVLNSAVCVWAGR